MIADIPRSRRAEDRVGQRMERDIGIGVPGKAMRMFDFDAAKPKILARCQAVYIEPEAGSGVTPGGGKIGGVGDLAQGFVAFDQCHFQPGSARYLGVVASVSCAGPCLVSAADFRETKRLWGLNAVEGISRYRAAAVTIKAVGHGQCSHSAG